MLSLIYFIIVLGLIVLVHEFGHFIFSKLFGVHVYEFSIGMGPRIFGTKKQKGKTQYNVRALPIGGFVSLAGEDATDKDPEVPKDGYLYNKPIWQRFIIMAAGVFNNFLLALIVLFLIGIFHGAPDMSPVVTKLDVNKPMYEAGIREGDRFISINGNKTSTIDDVNVFLTLENNGKETEFVMERDGVRTTYKITPVEIPDEEKTKEEKKSGEPVYKYGISFDPVYKHGFGAAVEYTFVQFGSYFKQIILTFKYLFSGKVGADDLAGPVGIYSVVDRITEHSVVLPLASLTALLCVNVGFLNILPFPAFDGGRILFLLIEKIRRKPVSPKVENTVNTIGFCLLMVLILFITVNDVIKLFK